MAGGENKSDITRDKSLNRFFKLLATFSVVTCLTFGTVITSVTLNAGSKTLAGATLAGENLGSIKAHEATQKLNETVHKLQSKKITIEDNQTSLNELGIAIDAKNLESQIFISNLSFIEKVQKVFSSMGKENPINLSLITNNSSKQNIESLIEDLAVDSKNAYFTIDNNTLNIVADEKGKSPNINKVLESIQLALENNSTNISNYYDEIEADITKSDLEKIYPQVQSIVNQNIELSSNSKTWTISSDESLTWIEINKNNGNAEINHNDESIEKSVNKIATEIYTESEKEIKDSAGQVIQQGKNGQSLNKNQTIANIKEEINNRLSGNVSKTAIALSISTIAFTTATAHADSTAGLYDGKYIQISLKTQKLYQYEGHNLIGSYTISSGKASTPTPTGTFRINGKHPRAYSNMFGLYMPYWMSFIGSTYGLHELPEWPNGYKEGQQNLGTPVSAGCVRLGIGDAKKLYDWAEVGTPIVIH